jgi:arginine N-succinyltransferase
MIIVRSIKQSDFAHFVFLAQQAHLGFYTLPKEPALLQKRLEHSLLSFKKEVSSPDNELYIFVAEDTATGKLIGVSAIASTTGGNEPLYFFRRELQFIHSPLTAVTKKLELLSPVSYVRGPSELCSLFVLPNSRKSGSGRLLSLSRFLFIAGYPERFTASLMAELRGLITETNSNPFWEGIGRHFLNVSFEEVHQMLQQGRSILREFQPKYPIYISLLPESVQKCIGLIDPLTEGAFRMLQKQGFVITDEVDMLDGGPKLRAQKTLVDAVAKSSLARVAGIQSSLEEASICIAANTSCDFRACYAEVRQETNKDVIICEEAAQALLLQKGDVIRTYKFI